MSSPENFWSYMRSTKRWGRKIPILKDSAGQSYRTNEEKADHFGRTFFHRFQHQSEDDPVRLNFFQTIQTYVDKYFTDNSPLVPEEIQFAELEDVLMHLKERSAPGMDGIRNNALRHLSTPWKQFLLTIFNACFKCGYFPDGWKSAVLVMLHKKGSPSHAAQNYRPISLLPAVSKVFERCVQAKLARHLEINNVLPDSQYGFRKGHSCTHQLWRLTETILHHWNMKHKVTAVFLDVEKAYDAVWRVGVLYKLIQKDTPRYLLFLLRSFLQDRSFKVKVGECLSQAITMVAGLPQGAVLSPILYAAYTADIPSAKFTDTFLYADDTALVSYSANLNQSVTYLQRAVERVYDWMKLWRMAINARKSQAMVFYPSARKPKFKVSIGGQQLDWSKQATYLGIIYNPSLSFGPHIQHLLDKMGQKLRYAYFLLGRHSLFNTKIKAFIYTVYFRSVWAYGLPCWCTISATHWRKLQCMQNKFLKMILSKEGGYISKIKDIHRKTELPSVTEHAQSIVVNFLEQLDDHPNASLTK